MSIGTKVSAQYQLETIVLIPKRECGNGYIGDINAQFARNILDKDCSIEKIYRAICALDKTHSKTIPGYPNFKEQAFYMLNGRLLKADVNFFLFTSLDSAKLKPHDIEYYNKYFKPTLGISYLDVNFIRELHALIIASKVARSIHLDYSPYKDRATILFAYFKDLRVHWTAINPDYAKLMDDIYEEFNEEFKKL